MQESFTHEQLLDCGHGRMFGPGNAQLPLPPMLMFDRIVHVSDEGGEYGKGEIVAELDLNPDLWFSSAISRMTQSCRAALASMRCGS